MGGIAGCGSSCQCLSGTWQTPCPQDVPQSGSTCTVAGATCGYLTQASACDGSVDCYCESGTWSCGPTCITGPIVDASADAPDASPCNGGCLCFAVDTCPADCNLSVNEQPDGAGSEPFCSNGIAQCVPGGFSWSLGDPYGCPGMVTYFDSGPAPSGAFCCNYLNDTAIGPDSTGPVGDAAADAECVTNPTVGAACDPVVPACDPVGACRVGWICVSHQWVEVASNCVIERPTEPGDAARTVDAAVDDGAATDAGAGADAAED
jgi:hypothetical protein